MIYGDQISLIIFLFQRVFKLFNFRNLKKIFWKDHNITQTRFSFPRIHAFVSPPLSLSRNFDGHQPNTLSKNQEEEFQHIADEMEASMEPLVSPSSDGSVGNNRRPQGTSAQRSQSTRLNPTVLNQITEEEGVYIVYDNAG